MQTGYKALAYVTALTTAICIYHFVEGGDKHTRRLILKTSFCGTVVSKLLNPEHRFQPEVLMTDGFLYSLQNSQIYEQVNAGDQMCKSEGQLKYYLIRQGDTTAFYQFYGDDAIR